MKLLTRCIKSIEWIGEHSLSFSNGSMAICATTRNRIPYPEVTGYLIPTLRAWGEHELAVKYGRFLLDSQNVDGSFSEPAGKFRMVFDTGQSIRGLISLETYLQNEEITHRISKSIDWMISVTQFSSGQIDVPDIESWGNAVPPQVLLYSFAPVLNYLKSKQDTVRSSKVRAIIQSILELDRDQSLNGLNHFHAYFIFGVLEIGEVQLARSLMNELVVRSDGRGCYNASFENEWMCSTGQFQIAEIWFRLGELQLGNAALRVAMARQNRSGGWFGSYNKTRWPNTLTFRFWNRYFARTEIPWANKFFLDAVAAKLILEFDKLCPLLPDEIESSDGRLLLVKEVIGRGSAKRVLDVGCGKGRYLKQLDSDSAHLVGMDISTQILSQVPKNIETRVGSLLNISASDMEFDLVLVIESLEHCVNVPAAIRELTRVTKQGGQFLIIDKHRNVLRSNAWRIPDWEQWFSLPSLVAQLQAMGVSVQIYPDIEYEGGQKGLFFGLVCSPGGFR